MLFKSVFIGIIFVILSLKIVYPGTLFILCSQFDIHEIVVYTWLNLYKVLLKSNYYESINKLFDYKVF